MTRSFAWASVPLAPASDARLGFRRVCADVAVIATIAMVVALFLVSPMLLEHFGVSYLTAGGSPAAKFHPASFLAVVAIAARCLATRRPVRSMWHLFTDDRGVVTLILAVGVAAFFAVVIAKSPVTPLVDTFVLPIFCLVLMRGLDPAIVRVLALLVAAILCGNAILGIVEMIGHTRFVTLDIPEGVSSDPTRGDAVFDWRAEMMNDWRATALLGHPLVNALIAGAFVICLAAPGAFWLPPIVRIPLIVLQLAAMVSFGARASMVTSIALAGYLALAQAVEALRRGARLTPRAIAIAIVAVGVAIIAAAILNETGFFDRMAERFTNDAGSAKTRFTMLQMFQPLGWDDLLLAPDPQVVATWQRLNGLEFGIESSWIGLALIYGLIVTGVIVAGLLAFSATLIKTSGRGSIAVLVFYLIAVSGTASLSGKTTTFAMVEVLILLFLEKGAPKQARAMRLHPREPLVLEAAPEDSVWDAGFGRPYGARAITPARALPLPRR